MTLQSTRQQLGVAAIFCAGVLFLTFKAQAADPVTDAKEAGVVATARSAHAVLRAVPIQAVKMEPGFWQPKMEANRTVSIPKLLTLLEEHGVVDNFRRLSGRKQCERRGPYFTDSDLYKWMEGAALALESTDDPGIKASLGKIIDEVLATQGKDGYINTWFQGDKAGDRFKQLPSHHELYCAGHLFQAAVADYRATGDRKLLEGAVRFADYLVKVFGPNEQFQGHDGHPEMEMALVELYRTTGQKDYLELAEYYLDSNKYAGRKGVDGHAVRMMYLCCGATDYFAETGREDYQQTSLGLWNDMVAGKLYVTGGVGARGDGEAFGEPFELPNRTAYSETCASIANGMWNWRMLTTTGEAKYMDLFERVLYNAFLSGVSLKGGEYFYVNPLTNDGRHRRSDWYDCTCCPPNVQRTMASIPGYIFTTSDQGVQVHLYDNCRLDWKLADGSRLAIHQQTRYPWDGTVTLEVSPAAAKKFDLDLRIPGWCKKASIEVNGEKADVEAKPASYARLSREWKPGDKVSLQLPMPVVALVSDDRIAENRGRVALARGPVVYCLEGTDNPSVAVERVRLPIDPATREPAMMVESKESLLGGVSVIRGDALEAAVMPDTELYQRLEDRQGPPARPVMITAIPYYAWANRDNAPMTVWIAYELAAQEKGKIPGRANTSAR